MFLGCNMSLYEQLVERVENNKTTRMEEFGRDMRKSFEKRINSVNGYAFPVTVQVTLKSQTEANSQFMTIIKELMRKEGFNNFTAEFGRNDPDPREYGGCSYSYVTLTINKNHGS
ncbi:hypothetical protein VPHK567_0360 [Vibrio phage K567]